MTLEIHCDESIPNHIRIAALQAIVAAATVRILAGGDVEYNRRLIACVEKEIARLILTREAE